MPWKPAVQFRVFWTRRRLEQSCGWSAEQLARHQQNRIAELRRFAAERSPFYQRFHRGMEDRPLRDLPILTKSVLMEDFDELVTDRSIRLADVEAYLKHDDGDGFFQGQYVALSTSGSTGLRGVFLFNRAEWIECVASIARPMKWAGVAPNPFRRSRAAMLASSTPWHYSARIGRALATSMMPTLRLDAAEPVAKMVDRLNEWQPQVLIAYPSVLRQLAEEQLCGRLRISPRTCATSAEVLTAETRRRVREAWGLRVFETYGATEYAPIAAECPAGRRHLFEDGAIIENVDEYGRLVPPGIRGNRVLLTVFGRRTQPLIRYEISDMVRFSNEICECGRPFRCLEDIEGREEDVLYFNARGYSQSSITDLKQKIAVHPNLFHRVLETVLASGWQVVQDDEGLSVNLTGLRDDADRQRIEVAIRGMLEDQGIEAPAIRVSQVAELRRGKTGKAPLIVSLSVAPASRPG